MKTTFKVLGLLLIAGAMVFNLKISETQSDKSMILSYVKNTAQADGENPQKYATKVDDNYTRTTTVTNSDNTSCTKTATYHVVECGGNGNLECTPSSSESNVKYEGNCH
jgi:hypothetical protein